MPEGAPGFAIRGSLVAAYLLRGAGEAARTLLMKRAAPPLEGTWSHVAGSIEEGETAWQAALREIAEETGLAPKRLFFSDLCEQFYEPAQDRVQIVPVFVGLVADDAEVSLDSEHTDHAWCTLDEAVERLVFPAQRRIARLIWTDFVDTEPTPWLEIAIPN